MTKNNVKTEKTIKIKSSMIIITVTFYMSPFYTKYTVNLHPKITPRTPRTARGRVCGRPRRGGTAGQPCRAPPANTRRRRDRR